MSDLLRMKKASKHDWIFESSSLDTEESHSGSILTSVLMKGEDETFSKDDLLDELKHQQSQLQRISDQLLLLQNTVKVSRIRRSKSPQEVRRSQQDP